MAKINIFMNKGLIERQTDVIGIETDILLNVQLIINQLLHVDSK